MGLLEDAIREHLDLKRKHGASEDEVERQEVEALGPVRRDVTPPEEDEAAHTDDADETAYAEEPAGEAAVAEEPAYEAEDAYTNEAAPPDARAGAEAVVEPPAEEPPVAAAPVEEAPVEDAPFEEPAVVAEPPAEAVEQDEPFEDEHEPFAEADEPFGDEPRGSVVDQPTELFDVEEAMAGDTPPQGFPAQRDERPESEPVTDEDGDVLEDTPDFLQDAPEHDRLWFEQKPPRDFDFD